MSIFSPIDKHFRDHGLRWAWLWVLLIAFLVGNVVGLFTVGIHPDEAYYWVWSERLDAGYFDHPPMVAWEIRLFTSIFGDHPWVIRLPAVLAWLAINVSVYVITRDAFPKHWITPWLAVLVATSVPLYQVGFHVITPDSPYLLFTAISYWTLYLALTRDPRWWLATGVFVGLSLLSKYIAVLFPAAVFIALILSAKGRQHLLTPWPWLAIAVAALVFSPVVYWNAQHDWLSFLFQLGHGVNLKNEPSLSNVLLYIGSQLVVAMPWVFVAMIVAVFKSRPLLSGRESLHAVMVSGFAFPLIFFALTGFTMISGAHWPAAAYIPGSVLLGGMLGRWLFVSGDSGVEEKHQQRSWLVVVIVLAALLSMLLANVVRYRGNTQLANTFGWPEAGEVVKDVYDRQPSSSNCNIVTDYWGLSAAIAFALNMPHRVITLPGGKYNQYDIWRDEDKSLQTSESCVYVEMSHHSKNFSEHKETSVGDQWQLERVHEVYSPVRTRWLAVYVQRNKAPK